MNNKTFKNVIFLILIALSATAQNDNHWALGLKIGEPLGLNIRKYFSYGDKAFDLNIGTYGFIYGGTRYYNKKRNPDPIYNELGLMVQGIYSWNRTLGKRDRINYYYGFGLQINSRDRPLSSERDTFRVTSFGPAGNSGIEFKLPENDLSVFIDAGGYIEIVPKIFFLNPQANVGLRLNIVK